MANPAYDRLLVFSPVMVATWLAFIYAWPRLILTVYRRAILGRGLGEGPVPLNTLYLPPQEFFADPLSLPASAPAVATTGVNRDTLYTLGWLDLRGGPQMLHVPDMAGRYYSVQLTDPRNNTNFAYVGKRATGTAAGDYLISGPGWKGAVPAGMARISAPTHSVLIIGRVLVESDGDLPTAHALAKRIQLLPWKQAREAPPTRNGAGS